MTAHDAQPTLSATVRAPRSYGSWLMELVAVGQVYGVNTPRWNETLTAAYTDLLFRVWALQDDAKVALGVTS